jgi:hypothetical protein
LVAVLLDQIVVKDVNMLDKSSRNFGTVQHVKANLVKNGTMMINTSEPLIGLNTTVVMDGVLKESQRHMYFHILNGSSKNWWKREKLGTVSITVFSQTVLVFSIPLET